MPRPDPPEDGRARRRGLPKKRSRRKGDEPEREPVEPNNPRPLAGGAAAPLEFDD